MENATLVKSCKRFLLRKDGFPTAFIPKHLGRKDGGGPMIAEAIAGA